MTRRSRDCFTLKGLIGFASAEKSKMLNFDYLGEIGKANVSFGHLTSTDGLDWAWHGTKLTSFREFRPISLLLN